MGRIQTPPQFAGVSAPCPYCGTLITAPGPSVSPPPASVAPTPPPPVRSERATVPGPRPIKARPRTIEIRPVAPPPSHTTTTTAPDAADKLEQLFQSMVELEHQLDQRARKRTSLFDKPVRRI